MSLLTTTAIPAQSSNDSVRGQQRGVGKCDCKRSKSKACKRYCECGNAKQCVALDRRLIESTSIGALHSPTITATHVTQRRQRTVLTKLILMALVPPNRSSSHITHPCMHVVACHAAPAVVTRHRRHERPPHTASSDCTQPHTCVRFSHGCDASSGGCAQR